MTVAGRRTVAVPIPLRLVLLEVVLLPGRGHVAVFGHAPVADHQQLEALGVCQVSPADAAGLRRLLDCLEPVEA